MKHTQVGDPQSSAEFSIRAAVECSCGARFSGTGWTRGPALTAALTKLRAHIAEFEVPTEESADG